MPRACYLLDADRDLAGPFPSEVFGFGDGSESPHHFPFSDRNTDFHGPNRPPMLLLQNTLLKLSFGRDVVEACGNTPLRQVKHTHPEV
jgi:hypothetical protein